jgi:hypothetical protein
MPNPPKRARHSAFDDFPVEDAVTEKPELETVITPQKIRTPQTNTQMPVVERIERLKPCQMIPDRFQPRRLLPSSLRGPFFSGEIDCYQTAERWLALARQDNAHRNQIERLLSMGESFDEHGQIKPITGSWVNTEDGRYIFQIETGERRFWAACLTKVSRQTMEEPQLRVEVITHPTRQRQVLENRHAEPPSAVGQSCEIASLILSEMGVTPPADVRDEFDFFRQARSQRMPSGLWEKIMPVMQLTRPRMVQLLNILQLPTYLLDMADRFRLPERVLREVLSLPPDQWERMVFLSIQKNLTSDEIYDASTQQPDVYPPALSETSAPSVKTKKPAYVVAVGGIRRFANTMRRLDSINQSQAFDEIADELVGAGDAESVINLLDELTGVILARLKRK